MEGRTSFVIAHRVQTVMRADKILALLRAHWSWTLVFILLIALVSVQDSFFTYVSKLLNDEAIVPGDSSRLMELVTVCFALALVQAASMFGFIYPAGILGERVQYDLRKTMFNHLQELSFSYFDQTPLGWIMSRVTSDSGKIAELVTWGLVDIPWGLMNITTSFIFMSIINWRLALNVLAVVPIMVLVSVQFQRLILAEYRQVRKLNSKLTGVYSEMISGVRVIKALCREEKNLDEFSGQAPVMYRASYRAAGL